jgi:hypothetical protein
MREGKGAWWREQKGGSLLSKQPNRDCFRLCVVGESQLFRHSMEGKSAEWRRPGMKPHRRPSSQGHERGQRLSQFCRKGCGGLREARPIRLSVIAYSS